MLLIFPKEKTSMGQIIFDIILTICKRNGIKRVLELEMAKVESGGHDKVLAHFGNLVLYVNGVLNDWIGAWPFKQSCRESQEAYLDQRSMEIG